MVLPRDHVLGGKRCQAGCGKRICVGQAVVVHQPRWDEPNQGFAAHVSCLRRVLADAPDLPDEAAERSAAAVADLVAMGNRLASA